MDDSAAYHVVNIVGDDGGRELEAAAQPLQSMLDMRQAWAARWEAAMLTTAAESTPRGWAEDAHGVVTLNNGGAAATVTIDDYIGDMRRLRGIVQDGHCRSATRTRLDILERKYLMYRTLNQGLEAKEDKTFREIPIVEPVSDVALLTTGGAAGVGGEQHPAQAHLSRIFSFQQIAYVELAEYLQAVKSTRGGAAGGWNADQPVVLVMRRPAEDANIDLRTYLRRSFLPFWTGVDVVGAREDGVAPAPNSALRPQICGFLYAGRDEGEEMTNLAAASAAPDTPLHRVPDTLLIYYIWRAVAGLNQCRVMCAQPALTLTLHAVHRDHLISGYLLCSGVRGGTLSLEKQYVLAYMYYLMGVGIACAPVHEARAGGIAYHTHPIQRLLAAGLRVSVDARAAVAGAHVGEADIAAAGAEDAGNVPDGDGHSSGPPRGWEGGWGGFRGELATCMNVFRLSLADAREVGLASYTPLPASTRDLRADLNAAIRTKFRSKTLRDEHCVLRSAGERAVFGAMGRVPKEALAGAIQAKHLQNIETYIDIGRLDINGPPIREDDPTDRPLTIAAEIVRQALLKRKQYIPGDEEDYVVGAASDEPTGPITNTPAVSVAAALAKAAHATAPIDDVWSAGFARNSVFGADPVVSLVQYIRDYKQLCDAMVDPRVLALANRRLRMLQYKYDIHSSLRRLDETGIDAVGRNIDVQDNRDFYQAVVVDTHVHMAAGMTARELLDFIQGKATYQSDDIVSVHGGERTTNQKVKTLGDVMKNIGVDAADLTVGSLGVQADATVFERFDNFNSKYSPLGKNDLRNLFLKTQFDQPGGTDVLEGRYFAELIKKTFRRMAPNHFSEFRLSIYGKSADEWDRLATWHSTHGMSTWKNRWLIQIPRIYPVLKKTGKVASFADMLRNVFAPLWEASAYPGKHPQVDHFLRYTSGFDSVDSEDGAELAMTDDMPPPSQWTSDDNPPYAYWTYYMWANISALNAFRRSRGLSTFSFRPHCGECGNPRHLAAAFLTADGVSHGIQLRLSPPLQYLYYLAQIPVAVSPLSNNSLFLDLEKSPFPAFFKQGLNVSLSTDDPLFFHQTQEPLIEEYSVASKLWRLSSTDLCEIARNSVRQSGFPHAHKLRWGGRCYFLDSSISNVEAKTHVPDLRVAYRYEVYHDEVFYLNRVRAVEGRPPPPPCPRYMRTLNEEDAILMRMGRSRAEELQHKRAAKAKVAAKL